jgi:hypothetical protein
VKVIGTSVTASSAYSSLLMSKTVLCLPPYSDQSYQNILTRMARHKNRWIEQIRPARKQSQQEPADTDVDSNGDNAQCGTRYCGSGARETAIVAALNELVDFLLQNAYPVLSMNTKHVGVMAAMARRMWTNVADFLNGDSACRQLLEAMCGGACVDGAAPPLSSYVSQLKKILNRHQVLDRIIQHGVRGPCTASIRDGEGGAGRGSGAELVSVELTAATRGQPAKSLLLTQEFAVLRKNDCKFLHAHQSLSALLVVT